MFQQLLYVALTVLIIGLTLYLIRRMDLSVAVTIEISCIESCTLHSASSFVRHC
jgi:hypothetical protein